MKKNLFTLAVKDAKGQLKKGNIVMLAVAFILGTVFGAVVSSFANDILMGAIANVVGKQDLDGLAYGAIKYGRFIGVLIYFVIVTFFVFVFLVGYFLIVRYREQRKLAKNPVKEEVVAPALTTEQLILEELKALNSKMSKK
ncbi:MscL family protein [Mycoplasmopsis columboralis]|uniref:Large conductance mechanosensitive channel protein n=1 Tax=Mycoplasmopsis columboralis TaxID=171282 RepID=A0A449B614_9BACT|nr:MscL family protein [Mycoplasmopsis columboralis]VEU76026.1 large conductance mechanosensitive channel protein [Mycoplasmopsis columboralis]